MEKEKKSLASDEIKSEPDYFGGEVTNDSNVSWLISGESNSSEDHFIWLPPGKNSDELPEVAEKLKGDVDAVWPAGKKLKNYYTGNIWTSGAFKLKTYQNTNIDEDDSGQNQIWDFNQYFSDSSLPSGWKLPDKFK